MEKEEDCQTLAIQNALLASKVKILEVQARSITYDLEVLTSSLVNNENISAGIYLERLNVACEQHLCDVSRVFNELNGGDETLEDDDSDEGFGE